MAGQIFIGDKQIITDIRITNSDTGETFDVGPAEGNPIWFKVRQYDVPWDAGTPYTAQIQTPYTEDAWSLPDTGGFVRPVPEPTVTASLLIGMLLVWVMHRRRGKRNVRSTARG